MLVCHFLCLLFENLVSFLVTFLVDPPPMDGFLQWEMERFSDPVDKVTDVFNVFTPDRVPIISTLAQEFAIFDSVRH